MASIFSFGTSAVRLDEVPAQTFFRILTHDDRSSFYCVARRDSFGSWREFFATADQLANYTLFDTEADWYVSRNGFTRRSRKGNHIRQVNAFMFDIDCHSGNADSAVTAGIHALNNAFAAGRLPQPNLLVHTGRGLHLYYVLDRSLPYHLADGSVNTRGISFFRAVETQLLAALRAALENVGGLDVDTAVFDFSRVGRIPGTYNVSARRAAELLQSSEQFYTLSQLQNALKGARSCNFNKTPVQGVKEAPENIINGLHKYYSKSSFSQADSREIAHIRLEKIAQLQELRGFDCMGSRELLCFCFYNTAVQTGIARQAALKELEAFNARFSEPLSHAVLSEVARSVDKVGFYRMKTTTLACKLLLTSDEAQATSFFQTRRSRERAQAKEQTALRRSARNARIVELYQMPGATMASVAALAGVSRRTVASVLKQAGVSRSRSRTVISAVAENTTCYSSAVESSPQTASQSLVFAARRTLFFQNLRMLSFARVNALLKRGMPPRAPASPSSTPKEHGQGSWRRSCTT